MTDFDFNTTFRQRMLNDTPLSLADFREMYSWFVQTYQTRVADIVAFRAAIQLDQSLLETRKAIQQFDGASAKLGRRLNFLTWVLVGLTVVVAMFTVMLYFKR